MISRQRAVLAIACLLLAVVQPRPQAALAAQPAPPVADSDPRALYREIHIAAERSHQDLLAAQENVADRRSDHDRGVVNVEAAASAVERAAERQRAAAARLEQARASLTGRQQEVNALLGAAFTSARLDALTTVLAGRSVEDVLDRAALLRLLVEDQQDLLLALGADVRNAEAEASAADIARLQAEDAHGRASGARDAAAKRVDDAVRAVAQVERRVAALDSALGGAHAALTASQAAEPRQQDLGPAMSGTDAAGAAGAALRYALAQVGKRYVWGAVGPDAFDCSGLVQTAYRSTGVVIPRVTYDQVKTGAPVARGDVRPGDLVFFHSPPSHVAMVVDSTWSVHAATSSEPIKVSRTDDIGPITAIRRVVP